MAGKISFGTDGWRAAIADDYTFENVKRCAQGFANYNKMKGNGGKWFVVGYDRRFLSEKFALAAAEVMAANGFKVYLTDRATPTPVISFSVVNKKAAGAINITASHNPFSDNGFKVRNETGGAINPDGLKEIEAGIPDGISDVLSVNATDAIAEGSIVLFDPETPYLDHIKLLVDVEPIKNAGITILVDAMWGNGSGYFPKLLSGGTSKVIEIHAERNPIFPEMARPEPIPPNINPGLKATLEHNADVLIINDGDADRIGVGSEKGEFINQLSVYALLAYYFLEVRGERGPIVRTLSTTSMLDKLGTLYNIPVYETGVGFKYVAPKMIETDALIGGEESGGYAFRSNVPERDGILAGLYLLDMMVRLNKKPSELIEQLFSIIGSHYYDRIDKRFTGDIDNRKKRITSALPETIGGMKVTGFNDTDGYKFTLEDGGWLLIRFSGTEPIIRVYCETTQADKVQPILKDGLKIAGLD